MAKRAGRKGPAPPVACEFAEFMIVEFSDEFIEERETFRRLAHRVVDLLVDNGRDKWLHEYVAESLAYLAQKHVIKKVTDFVHEVLADDS